MSVSRAYISRIIIPGTVTNRNGHGDMWSVEPIPNQALSHDRRRLVLPILVPLDIN